MRKFTILIALAFNVMSIAQIRVISDQKLCEGYYPRLSADASVLTYLDEENAAYVEIAPISDTYVTNEDLKLVLYKHGKRIELYPDGKNVNYIWSSVSPDESKIVYNTRKGTSVCDLSGKHIAYLGHLNAPVWYGNEYVVGMHDMSDGHVYTASSIAIYALASGKETQLTDAKEMAMYPSVSEATGKIAYNTLDGEIHLMQLNLTTQPISNTLPNVKVASEKRKAPQAVNLANKDFKDLKIYINPGHGGHGSNDRPIRVYPFASGDPNGFWESNSNLTKGLALDSMLNDLGVQTMMSRRTNNDGGAGDEDVLYAWLNKGEITQEEHDYMLANGDDRALSAIVAEANAYKADFMLSIHSNAGGPANYVLQLYAGKDEDDPKNYATPTPVSEPSRNISTIIGNNLQSNTLTPWTRSTPWVVGDKTFGTNQMGWSNGYGVLRGLVVPGEISEGSMHDYIPQTYRMMNMDYRKMEAWMFTKSFMNYFMNYTLPTGVIAGQVRDGFNKQLFPDIKRIRNSNDELEPLCAAKVILMKDNNEVATYTTDSLYNGLFFFWNMTPGEYTLKVEKEHYYTKEVAVTVTAGEMLMTNVLMDMKRETRPEVVSYSPNVEITDSVEVFTPIVLNFNWDMLESTTSSAFSISPAVEGTIEYSNSQKTMTFTPTVGFEAGVEYTVTLAKTACHPDFSVENTLATDFTFKFRTKNRPGMQVLQTYPENGATGVNLNPTILVLFDAKVHSKSGAPQFSITDGADYSFTPSARVFSKNKVTEPYGSARFEVSSEMKPNTTYTVTISEELKDQSNVPMAQSYSFSFTTGDGEEEVVAGEVIINCDEQAFVVDTEKTKALEDKSIMTSKTKKTEGTMSNEITYTFNTSDPTPELFLKPVDLTNVFTSVDTIAIDVYGDISMNELFAEFSTEGDVHLISLGVLDFAGWKTFEVAVEDLPQAVQFQLTGLKIVQGTSILSPIGDIYIDNIRRIKGSVISSLEEISAQEAVQYYDVLGRQSDKPFKGLNITSDGQKELH